MTFSDRLSHLMFILILRCFSLKFGFQIPKLASISMSVLKCHGCQLSNKSFDLRDSCRQIKTKCRGRKNISFLDQYQKLFCKLSVTGKCSKRIHFLKSRDGNTLDRFLGLVINLQSFSLNHK